LLSNEDYDLQEEEGDDEERKVNPMSERELALEEEKKEFLKKKGRLLMDKEDSQKTTNGSSKTNKKQLLNDQKKKKKKKKIRVFKLEDMVMVGWWCNSVSFTLSFHISSLETVATPITHKYFHWSTVDNSEMFAAIAGLGLISTLTVVYLAKKGYPDRSLLTIGFAMSILALFFMLIANHDKITQATFLAGSFSF